jgi:hypothetical protein
LIDDDPDAEKICVFVTASENTSVVCA